MTLPSKKASLPLAFQTPECFGWLSICTVKCHLINCATFNWIWAVNISSRTPICCLCPNINNTSISDPVQLEATQAVWLHILHILQFLSSYKPSPYLCSSCLSGTGWIWFKLRRKMLFQNSSGFLRLLLEECFSDTKFFAYPCFPVCTYGLWEGVRSLNKERDFIYLFFLTKPNLPSSSWGLWMVCIL